MSRTSPLRSYFESVNRLPRASASSSGLVAGLETRKSSTGSTIPEPKKWAQTRLANEVANQGFSGEASHFGQDDPTVLAGDVGGLAAEELGLHLAVADGVVHLAAAGVEDDDLALVFGLLAADLREEGGEAVIVVLGPAVERVVVALGALDPHPHEDLGDVLGHLQGDVGRLVEVGRGVLERPAVGPEELLDHLVHRRVLGELLDQPVVVEEHRLVADRVRRLDLEDLGPLVDPELGELLAPEQLVDQLGPLVRVGRGHERPYSSTVGGTPTTSR